MNSELEKILATWSEKYVLELSKKGCGMINCRSKLRNRNPVRGEIQQILDKKRHCRM